MNHNSSSITEALGITEERDEEIFEILKEANDTSRSRSGTIEAVLSNSEMTDIEKAYLCYRLGQFAQQQDSAHSVFSMVSTEGGE